MEPLRLFSHESRQPLIYYRIAVNVPQVSGLFDYHLPDDAGFSVEPGMLVVVPFGQQTVQGIVIQSIGAPSVAETKPILSALDPQPVVTQAQMRLAEWLA